MKTIFKAKLISGLFTIIFYVTLLITPIFSVTNNLFSIAEAHHKPWHSCSGKKCDAPPTVSEVPIEYMVSGGSAFILIAGGIYYFVQQRKRKQTINV